MRVLYIYICACKQQNARINLQQRERESETKAKESKASLYIICSKCLYIFKGVDIYIFLVEIQVT